MPTIYDIAAKTGVSISTVSRAFRHPELLSEATHCHIMAVAESMGYRPNRLARVLAEGRSRSLGLLLPWIGDNPFFLEIMKEFEKTVRQWNYEPVVASWRAESVASVLDEVHLLEDRMVEGLLLYTPPQLATELADLRKRPSLPTVLLGSYPTEGMHLIGPDESAAGYIATEHLLSLGHRHIAFICPWPEAVTWRREHGYLRALEGCGMEPVFVRGEMTASGGERAVRDLIALHPGVTAILAANDVTALGACRGFADSSVSVPEGMSVVGFDNLPITEYAVPRLTTVDLCARETVERGVRRLLDLTDGHAASTEGAYRTLLAPRLVQRQSTAPPRGPVQSMTAHKEGRRCVGAAAV